MHLWRKYFTHSLYDKLTIQGRQSRSTFTSPITEIDHDMSGGDESDDDDVSVGGASDPSDWSESGMLYLSLRLNQNMLIG